MNLPPNMALKSPAMHVVVKNSKNNRPTPETAPLVKVCAHQAIFRASVYALAAFQQIAGTLLEVEIRRCDLKSGDILSDCVNLRVACLADNKIQSLPKCFHKLHNLQIIDFSHNEISDMADVANLFLAPPSLAYIHLVGNKVTSIKHYRRKIYKLAPSISALDNYIITDLETLEYSTYYENKLPICSLNSSMYVDKKLYSIYLSYTIRNRSSTENQNTCQRAIERQCRAIHEIRRTVSPAGRIQRCYDRWVIMKKEDEQYHSFVDAVIKLQAKVRSFLWSRQLDRAINAIVNVDHETEEIETTVTQTTTRGQRLQIRSQQLVRWARRCLSKRRMWNICTRIQRWYRTCVRYHRGVRRWLERHKVRGIIFPAPFVEQVKDYLASFAGGNVTCDEHLWPQIQPYSELLVSAHSARRLAWYRSKEPSHPSLSAFEPGKQKEKQTYDERQKQKQEGRKRVRVSSQGARRDVSVYSLLYATSAQHKQWGLLKRRGVFYLTRRHNQMARRGGEKEKEERRDKKGGWMDPCHVAIEHKVFRIFLPDNCHLLWKMYTYLQLMKRKRMAMSDDYPDEDADAAAMPLYFDTIALRAACATNIQRVWRSHMLRKIVAPLMVVAVIRRRSVIAIQRWWRNLNSLLRRLKLLSEINQVCRGITSPVLYLDVWVFYHLLRCYTRPPHQREIVGAFPEFQGIPVFDDSGHLAIQPFIHRPSKHKVSCKVKDGDRDNRKSKPVVNGTSVKIPILSANLTTPGARCVAAATVGVTAVRDVARQCIPRWAPWRPKRQLAATSKCPVTHHILLFSLLTMHCDISVKSCAVPFKREHQLKAVRHMRVVELTFSSILEAQMRCAMLMLLTYDVQSHSSVTMMTEKFLQKRLHDKADLILSSRALLNNSCLEIDPPHHLEGSSRALRQPQDDEQHELYPVETQVLLTPTPPLWLVDTSQSVSVTEIVRFQFLCECLAKTNEKKRAKRASENFQELYQQGALNNECRRKGVTVGVDRPVSFVPLQQYLSKDDLDMATKHTTHDNTETQSELETKGMDFPAAYTQQLMAVPKPHVIRDRPKSAAAVSAAVRDLPADVRFRDKLWSKERVLLWCSNFDDSMPEFGTPATRKNGMNRGVSVTKRPEDNATSATASRLQMVSLATTPKTTGGLRFDAVSPPVVTPPTIKRDDFIAAQTLLKHNEVQKTLQLKKLQEEQRLRKCAEDLSMNKECANQVRASKSKAAINIQAWRSQYSARANQSVAQALDSARAATAPQNTVNEQRKQKTLEENKAKKASVQRSREVRQSARRMGSTLNTMLRASVQQAYRHEAQCALQQKRALVHMKHAKEHEKEKERVKEIEREKEAKVAVASKGDSVGGQCEIDEFDQHNPKERSLEEEEGREEKAASIPLLHPPRLCSHSPVRGADKHPHLHRHVGKGAETETETEVQEERERRNEGKEEGEVQVKPQYTHSIKDILQAKANNLRQNQHHANTLKKHNQQHYTHSYSQSQSQASNPLTFSYTGDLTDRSEQSLSLSSHVDSPILAHPHSHTHVVLNDEAGELGPSYGYGYGYGYGGYATYRSAEDDEDDDIPVNSVTPSNRNSDKSNKATKKTNFHTHTHTTKRVLGKSKTRKSRSAPKRTEVSTTASMPRA